MPKHIEDLLIKMSRKFLWETEKPPMIGLNTLRLPFEQGGQKVLDIKIRNEAIELMKTQQYLKLDGERPKWAYIADKLVSSKIAKKPTGEITPTLNIFLQDTTVDTRMSEVGLPTSLRRMIKTAKKYKVAFAPLIVSQEVKESMPMWLHRGIKKDKRILINSESMICLRDVHKIRTVGDMIRFGESLTSTTKDHKARRNCACQVCRDLRSRGCTNPHKCSLSARQHISKLEEKWDLYAPQETRTLGEEELQWTQNCIGKLFSLNIEMTTPLSNGFRVFTDQTDEHIGLINYKRAPENTPSFITIYTDGSCIRNERGGAAAGAGVWFGHGDARNRAIKLPYYITQTNNTGETIAILEAARSVPKTQSIIIKSDSQLVIDSLTTLLAKREDEGWIGAANKDILRPLIAVLCEQTGLTILEKVKGHSGVTGNEEADCLANQGAQKNMQDDVDLRIPRGYNVTRAKLAKATQALLYKGILEIQPAPDRRGTQANLNEIRWAIKETTGLMPTNSVIWKSIRSRALSKEIRNFLWKTIHNLYKIGKYWNNIQGFEERAACPACRTEESMSHILTECRVSGQEHVWGFVEACMAKRNIQFSKPSLGEILGCAIAGEERDQGKYRFHAIVISEAAYTIWKARCEWRISRNASPGQTLTKTEMVLRMRVALERKIKLDCLATDAERFGKKATKPKVVKGTWKNLIPANTSPLRSWRKITAVLVGIG